MTKKYEFAALVLRLILGITFFVHGFAKFQMGLGNVGGWFSSLGIPGFMGYVVAVIEFFGGIALILGLGTRIVAALLALVMIGAIITVKLSVGFLGDGQMAGSELDLALFAMAISLLITGSPLYSIDRLFLDKE